MRELASDFRASGQKVALSKKNRHSQDHPVKDSKRFSKDANLAGAHLKLINFHPVT
jgi:hypothetical protein